jgi:biopolymer transport protein ExbB
MNIFIKTAALAVGGALLMGAPANAQITSIDQLLNQVRQDADQAAADNRAREAKFQAAASQQSALLSQARGELASLEAKARRVQGSFDSNQVRIERLEGELKVAQGDFGEVFGLARAKAGEFKAMLDSSMISAQFPDRTAALATIAESKALPSSDELNLIWQRMLQEMKEQGKTTTFTADVANLSDSVEVTRVGPFNAFTKGSAEFLAYVPPAGDAKARLATMPKQPGGAISKAASVVAGTATGSLVSAPIDPTRGSLLKSFDRVPDWGERIAQGGPIGAIIYYGLLFGGVALGLLLIVRLFLISAGVRSQKKTAQASAKNPLGRIMLAGEGVRDGDEDALELKLDEAILRESPKLELGLNVLKLAAGIAPLLGLLGTVTGMIKTFQAMMIYGTGDPQLMAGGISEALVTTMLGLIAAIPLLILHSFCSSMARGVQGTLEEQSAGIVARHVENRRG